MVIDSNDADNPRLRWLRADGSVLVDSGRAATITDLELADTGPVAVDVDGDGATDIVLIDRGASEARWLTVETEQLEEHGKVADAAFRGTKIVGVTD